MAELNSQLLAMAPLQLDPGAYPTMLLPSTNKAALAPLVNIKADQNIQTHFPSYPVAVRHPYLNSWLYGNDALNVPKGSVHFWNGQILGLELGARINGIPWALFGYHDSFLGANYASQSSIELTGTHTRVTLLAGNTPIIVEFFNPVSPKDFVRQSLPYTYISVTPTTNNDDIQVYAAFDGSWTGNASKAQSNFTLAANNTSIFQSSIPGAIPFTENGEMAAWGSAVLASRGSDITSRCGTRQAIRSNFVKFTDPGSPTSCSPGDWMAIEHNLGKATSDSKVTFALGQSRQESIDYIQQPYISYHRIKYPTIVESVGAFLDDYDSALAESQALDKLIISKGDAISRNYTEILQLSLVQSFGASEITVDQSNPIDSSILFFTKEISSDGNLNTLDITYPTHPVYYALNPALIKYSLLPLLKFLNLPDTWIHNFAPHDMGSHYPNATGYKMERQVPGVPFGGLVPEFMPLQSTSVLLTMLYTYSNATGDTAFVQPYKAKLQLFADYLRANGTASLKQLQTVDGLGANANQTMLAISSAVGLVSFGRLFNLPEYEQAGRDLANRLWNGRLGTDADQTHFVFTYGNDSTYSVMFPLFDDKLLHFNLFPQEAYDAQSAWYDKNIGVYGLPYVSTVQFAISDWNMWAAAVSSNTVTQRLINTLRAYLSLPGQTKPFQTKYYAKGPNAGKAIQNIARSTVGSNFALSVLNGPWAWPIPYYKQG